VLHLLRTQALPGLEAADHDFLAKIAAGPGFGYLTEPSRSFSGPVLILSGRQEAAGHKHICDMLDAFPRATCAILDRTGHLLFAEQPALLIALATEWLDRVEEVLRGGPQSHHN
jgi:pimeloyl-ACP methyl ester carboxylesterase